MKLFSIICFAMLVLTQCKTDKEGGISQLIIKNNTVYDISMKLFYKGTLYTNHIISIKKKDSIIFSSGLDGAGCPPPSIWGMIGSPKDSVIIQFGNSYKLTHVSHIEGSYLPQENNSLNFSEINKTEKSIGKNKCSYYYYLTDEDIKRAQPL